MSTAERSLYGLGTVEDPPKTISYLVLGLRLDDIPTDSSSCLNCQGQVQKEFLQFESRHGSIAVCCEAVPGYGCTGCGLKRYHPPVVTQLFGRLAEKFHEFGEHEHAAFLEQEAHLVLAPSEKSKQLPNSGSTKHKRSRMARVKTSPISLK